MVELLAYRPVHVNTHHGNSTFGTTFWVIATLVVLFFAGLYVWNRIATNKRDQQETDDLTRRLAAKDGTPGDRPA